MSCSASQWVKSHLCVQLQGACGALRRCPQLKLKVERPLLYSCYCLLSLTPIPANRDWPDKTAESGVCVCVCVCVVLYVCVCAYVCVYTSVCVSVHPCVYVSVPASACLSIQLSVCWVRPTCADTYSEPCTFWGQNVATSCHKMKTVAGKQEGGSRCTGIAAMFLSWPLF